MTDLTTYLKKGLRNPSKVTPFTRKIALTAYRNASVWANSRWEIGSNIYDYDWDLLVLLDTCQPEALKAVQNEYPFLTEIGRKWSVGGQSAEWMANTFDQRFKDDIENTAYITANPHSKSVFENRLKENWNEYSDPHIERLAKWGKWDFVTINDLGHYEPVWKYDYCSEYKYQTPRPTTDCAIKIGRSEQYDRMMVHYMPPHEPYVANAIAEGREMEEYEESPIEYLRETGEKDRVYTEYLNMLRWVLDDVEILLENIDRENVVITADHGEAFGEYGIYRHHAGSLHPKIRWVPWVRTTANDRNSYSPEFDPAESTERSVDDALKALGYIQ